MNNFVTVRRFGYLKRPIYKWTLENIDGGAFSNSGEFSSLEKCFSHFFAMNGNVERDVTPVYVYDINANGGQELTGKMFLKDIKI